MKTGPDTARLARLWTLACASLLFALVRSPLAAAPDPFAFLPAKEALAARQALSSLDASLSAWAAANAAFVSEAEKARGAVEKPGDSSAFKALLESGASGAWKAPRGLSLASAQTGARKAAARFSALLESRIDKADDASLDGLLSALKERMQALPAFAPVYLDFVDRISKTDLASRRLALRALLEFDSERIALRLAPPDKALESLPYGSNPDLLARAETLRKLHGALKALRAVAPALAVPELSWTPEETLKAQEALRRLFLLDPALRGQALAVLPGLRLLPAFLSGLSPEEASKWLLDRKLSPRDLMIFFSCTEKGDFVQALAKTDSRLQDPALLRSITELERDRARGLKDLPLLARGTDPALRQTLRMEGAPPGLIKAYADAMDALGAALAARLGETMPAFTAVEGLFKVETEEVTGSGGFSLVKAYFESKEGGTRPVPAETVDKALEYLTAGIASDGTPAKAIKALEMGLLVPGYAGKAPSSLLRDSGMENATVQSFSALAALWSTRLRTEARVAGLAALYIYPEGLARLEDLCLKRCRGLGSDGDLAEALKAVGGPARAAALWDAAFRNLEATRRALGIYTRLESAP